MLSILRVLLIVRMLNGNGWALLFAIAVFCFLVYSVVH
jgi:hypothetical protein